MLAHAVPRKPAPMLAARGVWGPEDASGPQQFNWKSFVSAATGIPTSAADLAGMIAGGVTGYALNGGFSGAQQQPQGEGPWSSPDYVNGADLQSDQFHNAPQASIFDGLPSASEADYLTAYGPRGGDYYASQYGRGAQQVEYRVGMGGPGWDTDFTLPDGTPVLRSTINADDPTRLIGNLPLDANAPMVPGYSVDRIRTLEAWASKDVYYSPIPFDPQMVAAQEGFRSSEIGQMNRLAAVEEASAYMAREFPNSPEMPSSAQLWASSVFQRPPVFDRSGRPIQYISAPDPIAEARAAEARQRSVNNLAMAAGGPFIAGPMAVARAAGVDEAGVAQTGVQASAFLDLYAPRGGVARTSDIASRRRTSVMRANDGPQLPFDRMMPNYGPQQPSGTTGGVKPLDVGTYGSQAPRSVGDGMSPDHIPSFAAIRSSVENKLGRSLTPAEAAKLRNETNTLMIETDLHRQSSRTYGGRNSQPQVSRDALDLGAAALRDEAALRPALLARGYTQQEIDAAFTRLHAANKSNGWY